MTDEQYLALEQEYLALARLSFTGKLTYSPRFEEIVMLCDKAGRRKDLFKAVDKQKQSIINDIRML